MLFLVVGLASSGVAERRSSRTVRDMPPVIWRQLSENLWRIEDATVAYLVRNGDQGLLINIGAGRSVGDLSPAKVKKLDGVLVTHHLRPVTQGLPRAFEAGAWIAAPAGEARLLSEAEAFWKQVPLHSAYIFKPDLTTPAASVPVEKKLKGNSTFSWRGIDFEVLDTPGPTAGAVSLVAELDGRKVAFTGELIVDDGKIPNFWNVQYAFGDNGIPGMKATRRALARVLKHEPQWLLPARGEVIRDPQQAVENLDQRMDAVQKLFTALPVNQGFWGPDDHPLPHLYWANGSYLLAADDGHAVLIGYPGIDYKNWSGPDWLAKLRKKQIFSSIDAIFLLGYRDDHVGGVQSLATTFGCPVFTSTEVAAALRTNGPDPFDRYRAGQFDGRLKPNIVETGHGPKAVMRWRGYQLRFIPFGGHSYHQMGIFVCIDGERVLFSGDSIRPTNPLIGDFNCFCRVAEPGHTYADAAGWLAELKPNRVATTHHGLHGISTKQIAQYGEWAKAIEPTLSPLLAARSYRQGVNPNARYNITPFQVELRPPNQQRIQISVRNEERGPLNVQFRFCLPAGWTLQTRSRQDRRTFVDAGSIIKTRRKGVTIWTADLRLAPPDDLQPGRTVIPIDVVDGKRYLGQVLHLIIDHGTTAVTPWRPASNMTPYSYADKKYDLWDWLPHQRRSPGRILWSGIWWR